MIQKTYKQYDCIDIKTLPQDVVMVTDPEGFTRPLDSFMHQNISVTYDEEGFEHISLVGKAENHLRYYPEKVGDYALRINETNYPFTVIKSEKPGFITTSKKDPRYFSFTNGDGFLPVGINLAILRPIATSDGSEFGQSDTYLYLGLRQYERWFKACKENGVNMIRIWLGQDYLNPDTEEAGVFRPEQFTKLDMLVQMAEQYGLYLKLTVDQFRFFDYGEEKGKIHHIFNKNLYHKGKRCENSTEWLQEEKWQDLWLLKIKELAKRYGGNPHVCMIELWNEMNCVGEIDDLNAWNKKMLQEVKKLFPKQLVTNSFGSLDSEFTLNLYRSFCWDNCEVMQMHRYLDQGAEYESCHVSPLRFIPEGMQLLDKKNKPFLVAETGAVDKCHSGPFKFYSCDHRGILFCDCVYTPLFCGSAGCGHIWHWDAHYVESKNLYTYFLPFTELVKDVCFDEENFQTEIYEDENMILFLLRGKTTCLAYCRNMSDNWQRTLRDLQDSVPIIEKKLSVSLPGHVEKIDIWDSETATVHYKENALHIQNLKYGFFLKCK